VPQPPEAIDRLIVEHARAGDRYMRKHHSGAAAGIVRGLTAVRYAVRALLALGRRGRDARHEARCARAALQPERGQGMPRGRNTL
jgi:hypothetical protein